VCVCVFFNASIMSIQTLRIILLQANLLESRFTKWIGADTTAVDDFVGFPYFIFLYNKL